MKCILLITLLLSLLSKLGHSQPVFVLDKKAIAKSGENLAANLSKGRQHQKVRDFTLGVHENYDAMYALQQQVLDNLRQAETVQDLHWSDLSKSLYLATELIKSTGQPGLEIEYIIEHPFFERSPGDNYSDLFIAGSDDVLPSNLASWQQAQHTSQSLASSFHQIAAERKTFGAVAFQYLAEDLLLKATEMNKVLGQPERFSMTEAERLRLQTDAEEYLQLAGRLLARSDELLLEVTQVKPWQEQATQTYRRLVRSAIAQTPLFNF
ncbi:MAG: hypothetical protein AAF992_25570 [Bacteroidota bacterium]